MASTATSSGPGPTPSPAPTSTPSPWRSPATCSAPARTLLPDILHYDRTRPARYPNGRVLTDDVFSARMIFMVHGQATPQGVGPHDDLLASFPYLGPPNP